MVEFREWEPCVESSKGAQAPTAVPPFMWSTWQGQKHNKRTRPSLSFHSCFFSENHVECHMSSVMLGLLTSPKVKFYMDISDSSHHRFVPAWHYKKRTRKKLGSFKWTVWLFVEMPVLLGVGVIWVSLLIWTDVIVYLCIHRMSCPPPITFWGRLAEWGMASSVIPGLSLWLCNLSHPSPIPLLEP